MKKIVAIQSDKLKDINIKTDTTILLALEAQKRGYSVVWYETKDLNLINSKTIVYGKIVKFYENKKNFYKVVNKQKFNLAKVKYVLIRQNPPFNMDYITTTFLLGSLKTCFIEPVYKCVLIIFFAALLLLSFHIYFCNFNGNFLKALSVGM